MILSSSTVSPNLDNIVVVIDDVDANNISVFRYDTEERCNWSFQFSLFRQPELDDTFDIICVRTYVRTYLRTVN